MNILPQPSSALCTQLKQIIDEIPRDMILKSGGFCYAMCDMLSNMLRLRGIRHRIQEVELTASQTDPPRLAIIGKAGTKFNSEHSDSHVVVIVEDSEPILIDISIPFLMTNDCTYLMGVCRGTGDVIADFTASNKHYVYRQRKGGAFTSLHQKSIVERISADAEIFRNIKRLYWAILAMFVVVIAVQATAIYWRISISMELKDNTIDTLHGQELTRQNKELLEENQRLLHQLLKKQ